MTEQNNSELIIFEHASKSFGDFVATEDLTFSLPKGKIIGLIGPSGSGKTTTIRLLTGIYHPTKGSIKVFDKSPSQFTTKEKAKIGYLTQHFTLFPDLSIVSNMNFAASMYGQGILRRRKKINQLLELVELQEHRNQLAKKISGGMQRRLQLASTLIHDPELLLLDEPTAGIDPILRRKFWDYFEMLRDEGKTLFITTQYVNEASYCDLVGVLAEGKLLELSEPEELRRKAFGGEKLNLRTIERFRENHLQALFDLPITKNVRRLDDGTIRILVDDAARALPELMNWLQDQSIQVESLQQYQPPFDDVFVEVVERHLKEQETTDEAAIKADDPVDDRDEVIAAEEEATAAESDISFEEAKDQAEEKVDDGIEEAPPEEPVEPTENKSRTRLSDHPIFEKPTRVSEPTDEEVTS